MASVSAIDGIFNPLCEQYEEAAEKFIELEVGITQRLSATCSVLPVGQVVPPLACFFQTPDWQSD